MIVKLLGRRLCCPCKGRALGPAPGHGLGPGPGPSKALGPGPGPSRALYRRYSDAPPSIRDIDLAAFPPERIRNFCIVAHVDHGKSTLADRVLEQAGAIDTAAANKQVLDSLQVERERGITVKAQSASVLWRHHGEQFLLNLIDTPGHVDFSYEVTRSLRACQGVLLLVDANQGVQAQTVSNFFLAFAADLTILPVINKIDLPGADPELVTEQLLTIFEVRLHLHLHLHLHPHLLQVDPGRVLPISAKLGLGVAELLDRVEEVPPPPTSDRCYSSCSSSSPPPGRPTSCSSSSPPPGRPTLCSSSSPPPGRPTSGSSSSTPGSTGGRAPSPWSRCGHLNPGTWHHLTPDSSHLAPGTT